MGHDGSRRVVNVYADGRHVVGRIQFLEEQSGRNFAAAFFVAQAACQGNNILWLRGCRFHGS